MRGCVLYAVPASLQRCMLFADLQLVTARELGVKPVFDHTKVPTKTKQKGAPISLIVRTFIDTRCFGIHVACVVLSDATNEPFAAAMPGPPILVGSVRVTVPMRIHLGCASCTLPMRIFYSSLLRTAPKLGFA